MKRIVQMIVLAVLSLASLHAQTASDLLAAASQAYFQKAIDNSLSFLTPMQRAQFEKALAPALEKNPELVQQGLDLFQEGKKIVEENSPTDRDAYVQNVRDYEGRLKTAMLMEDPNVGTVFDAIDSHLKLPAAAPTTPAVPSP